MKTDHLAEDFFRQESGRVVASLVRSLGPQHLQLAEDVVQEALLKAMHVWPYHGVPENPGAWITLTARNLALDVLRRDQVFKRKQAAVFGARHTWSAQVDESDLDALDQDIDDAVLKLLFVCCHPALPPTSQMCLALRTLGGLGIAEIAAALFSTEAAVARKVTRAKDKLRDLDVTADLPRLDQLESRLDSVLKTLYLMFNEGYKASAGGALVRIDLCAEAMRLTRIVTQLGRVSAPRVHALMALMCYQGARLRARADSEGVMLLLEDQDRSRWDADLIRLGNEYLATSAQGDVVDSFHLQAAIAAAHCAAPSYAATDWATILRLYDILVQVEDSPVTRLNRAVAVGKVYGPEAGLAQAEPLLMGGYYLWQAVMGGLCSEAGQFDLARLHLEKALSAAPTPAEQVLLERRLHAVSDSLRVKRRESEQPGCSSANHGKPGS